MQRHIVYRTIWSMVYRTPKAYIATQRVISQKGLLRLCFLSPFFIFFTWSLSRDVYPHVTANRRNQREPSQTNARKRARQALTISGYLSVEICVVAYF